VDHKPLIPILNEYTLAMVENPRLQRLMEKTSMLDYKAVWEKGCEHAIPDALSRAPVSTPTSEDELGSEEIEQAAVNHVQVRLISDEGSARKDPVLQKVKEATATDGQMSALAGFITGGFPEKVMSMQADLQQFHKLRQDLSIVDGLILYQGRIIVPKDMRRHVLEDLHASHQGMERTKRRARQTVFWPNINMDIENVVRGCEKCQAMLPSHAPEPTMGDPLPGRPMEEVSVDLFEANGNHYLVYVDRYSGWPCVAGWNKDPTAREVIQVMQGFFADFGVPVRVKSDGGPQFKSREYQDFLKNWGSEAQLTSPHNPQANGHAEACVKAMKSLVKKTSPGRRLDRSSFLQGILEWRNTPKQCGLSPAQMLMGRMLRSTLPCISPLLDPKGGDEIKLGLEESREKAAAHHDSRTKTLPPLKIGERVWIQDHVSKRWTHQGQIKNMRPNRGYLIELENGKTWWRNRRFLRRRSILKKDEGEPQGSLEVALDSKMVTFEEPRRSTRKKKAPNRLDL